MGNAIEFSLDTQLEEDAAVQGDDVEVVGVVVDHLLNDLVALLEIELLEVLLCLDLPDVERLLLREELEHRDLALERRRDTLNEVWLRIVMEWRGMLLLLLILRSSERERLELIVVEDIVLDSYWTYTVDLGLKLDVYLRALFLRNREEDERL